MADFIVLFGTEPDNLLRRETLDAVEATLAITFPDDHFRFGLSPVCTSTFSVVQIAGNNASRSDSLRDIVSTVQDIARATSRSPAS